MRESQPAPQPYFTGLYLAVDTLYLGRTRVQVRQVVVERQPIELAYLTLPSTDNHFCNEQLSRQICNPAQRAFREPIDQLDA